MIDLATLVDYDKAIAVLVKVGNLFLMYNRATCFNQHTGEWGDSLTVTQDFNGRSEFRAGLRPGETYKSGDVVIEACKRVYGNDSSPDKMIISVGKARSACDELKSARNPAPPPVPFEVVDTNFPTASPP